MFAEHYLIVILVIVDSSLEQLANPDGFTDAERQAIIDRPHPGVREYDD